MFLILLYHHVNADRYSNRLDIFSDHLKFLADRYPIILPGEDIAPGKISTCLTFDDAYFDFYHYVFPLLRDLKIRALLGVSVRYIVESTTLNRNIRLSVPHQDAMTNETYAEKIPFCTWKEITEMAASGFVGMASHSYSHKNLADADVDLEEEIVGSKAILEKKLPQKINTFVYPFGRWNTKAHSLVTKHYSYAMRIGSALNKDWKNSRGMLYRVNADCLPDPAYPMRGKNLLKYYLKYLSNTVRGR